MLSHRFRFFRETVKILFYQDLKIECEYKINNELMINKIVASNSSTYHSIPPQ